MIIDIISILLKDLKIKKKNEDTLQLLDDEFITLGEAYNDITKFRYTTRITGLKCVTVLQSKSHMKIVITREEKEELVFDLPKDYIKNLNPLTTLYDKLARNYTEILLINRALTEALKSKYLNSLMKCYIEDLINNI